MLFQDLGLIQPILQAIEEEGYSSPTPIQEKAIPIVLKGKDLMACAQTGTGKTAAFAIPIIQTLYNKVQKTGTRSKLIKALVLTPTRELAIQVAESFSAYGRHADLRFAVIYGGVPQRPQEAALHRGLDILVATPGRLLDLMGQGFVKLNEVEVFVLDEADRMLDMGFVHDVKKVIAKLPLRRQNLLFSATMANEVTTLANTFLHAPERVEVTPGVSTAELIDQELYFVHAKAKRDLLLHILDQYHLENALVFTRTKHGANKLVKSLVQAGLKAEAIHGNKSQNARQEALKNFKSGKSRVLVATDIAARGIDIEALPFVINFELPNIPETYVHRIGRTGRASATGTAISFCCHEEIPYLKDILKLTRKDIKLIEGHPYEDKSLSIPTDFNSRGGSSPSQNQRSAPSRPNPNRPQNGNRGNNQGGPNKPDERVGNAPNKSSRPSRHRNRPKKQNTQKAGPQ